MKEKTEIVNKYYVTKADIQKLLGVNFYTAKKLYEKVDETEKQNDFRAFKNKVPLKEVLELAGVSHSFLKKQILNGK